MYALAPYPYPKKIDFGNASQIELNDSFEDEDRYTIRKFVIGSSGTPRREGPML